MTAQTMTAHGRTPEAMAARRRRRRRAELLDTVKEAAATIGIGVSFIACSILLICAM